MRAAESITCDVLVIGASASGTCAAVQAARMGLRTVLCEPTEWVGGMLTAAGVSAIDGNHHLPSGMFGEFRDALRAHYGGAAALETGWVSNTLYEPWVGLGILRRWIDALDSLELRTGETCTGILMDAERVTGAVFTSMVVKAAITIFADEYGDAVELAGLPWRTGLESRAETGEAAAPERAHPVPQDITWAATIRTPPSGFAADLSGPGLEPGDDLRHVLGEPPITWDRFLDYGRLPNDYVMLNFPTHDSGGDYLDHRLRDGVLARAKARTARLVAMLRDGFGPERIQLPDIYPGHMAAIPYIREARRIDAIATLGLGDLVDPAASVHLREAVAVGDYPVDHHRTNDPHAPRIRFPAVNAFSVPYGVMVPRDAAGVLVVEKSIGVTGLANGCTRLQPVVMQLGQAAGLAAYVCVTRSVEPRDVDVDELQELLLDRSGMLVPARDVPPGHPRFADLHRAAVRGERTLRYESEGWANKAFLDPE